MKKLIKNLVFLVSVVILFIPSAIFGSDFNANYILSDEEMQNYNSMDRSDIQAFLDDNGGYIARLRTDDVDGTRRLASDIIYRAAQEHRINSKYLLVKLQKEQSLVTDSNPSQKKLDGATGYGISDGCGWACDVYLQNKGFGKQVDSAASIMRWYYDNVSEKSWIKKPNTVYNIDNTRVIPANLATAFLYTYTPHLQGNQNFWNLWQRWFDQVYPNGSLVRTKTNPNVYVIIDGKKRLITSMTALVTRYNPRLVVSIPEAELARYESGPSISLPNYAVLKQADNYYLVDYENIRPFENRDTLRQLGYNPEEIIEVTEDDIKRYSIGSVIKSESLNPLGELVRVNENKRLYYLKDGVYQPIFDEKIAEINFPELSEIAIKAKDLEKYVEGDPLILKDGIIFGIDGSNRIYVTEEGEKRHIASEDVYTGMGYSWDNIVWINEFAGMIHKNGQAIYLRQPAAVASNNSENASWDTNEGLMYTTPKADTKYIGSSFETNIDAYLVADYSSGEILAGKNIDVVRPLASLTKVMASYKMMIEGLDLSRIMTYNPAIHNAEYHNFRVANGEMIRNTNLMDSFLVSSLNTPGRMLVNSITNDEKSFLSRMNNQARDWGLVKSNFEDPAGTGLGNKSTAREYLTIFTSAIKNPTIFSYLSKKSYEYSEILDKDNMPDHFDKHSNLLVNSSNLEFNILASKTAYLDEAGAGLAMLVSRPSDNKKFVIITMGNPDYEGRFNEPQALTNWALKNY